MLSPPPPLPGPGGPLAHRHHLPSDSRRSLSNHEVAEYLSSRDGEHDVYYHYQGHVPQTLWAVFLHQHPLLSARIQVRGDAITFVHTPSPDVPGAKEFAAARSHYTPGDLVREFHKQRYLANDRLAYLITGEEAFLLIVASCIESFEWGDELSKSAKDEMDEEELESVLENTLQSRLHHLVAHKFAIGDAVAALLRQGLGGQSFPEGMATRRTVYLDTGVTAAIKARCKEHAVRIPYVLVAACAVAFAQRRGDSKEPILIHLVSNHTHTRQKSTITLPCLSPPVESLLWRRARQASGWRRYNPLLEAQWARYVAKAADAAAMNNPGLGLGLVMPRRESPKPPDYSPPRPPPKRKVLLQVGVDVGLGPAFESGMRSGPALTVVVRETIALVFTDVPEVFVDDVLALVQAT